MRYDCSNFNACFIFLTAKQYKAHFSMWAIVNSPLLMGNDLRTLSAESLTILNNPAVVAINQDPLAKSAIRIYRNTNVAKDEYGQGEAQIWSGKLFGGDRVVAFLNAANEDVDMSASLKEIFIREAGKAPEVEEEWNVHDLWGNRMTEEDAQKILEGASTATFQKLGWYNATETSYEAGIRSGDVRLLGKFIGTVKPRGSLQAKVKRHSIEIFRLRNIKKSQATERLKHEEL